VWASMRLRNPKISQGHTRWNSEAVVLMHEPQREQNPTRVYNVQLERMVCIMLVDEKGVRYQNNTSNKAGPLNRNGNGIRGT
jgi:hypothetical protein